MRLGILVLLVGLFTLVSTGVSQAETKFIYSAGDGYLNLRKGPSTQSSIVRQMYNGSSVRVLRRQGNWAKVRHQSGSVGWAYAKYLSNRVISTHGIQYVYSPKDGYLNLRSGPSSKTGIVRRMYNGSPIKVFNREGNWVRVIHGSGDRGWAYGTYLVTKMPRKSGVALAPQSRDCSAMISSPVGWFITLNNCGDESLADYPSCLARVQRELCENQYDVNATLRIMLEG